MREGRNQYARRILNIDFKPLSDAPFCASVVLIFEDLRIVRATMNPGVTFRDEELVRDGDDSFGLMISQSTSLEIEHQRRNLRLSRGDATVMQVCETGSVGSRQHFGYIGNGLCAGFLSRLGTWLLSRLGTGFLRRAGAGLLGRLCARGL